MESKNAALPSSVAVTVARVVQVVAVGLEADCMRLTAPGGVCQLSFMLPLLWRTMLMAETSGCGVNATR